MSEWRPIETAPKDGTPVLLYVKEYSSTVTIEGWWQGGLDGNWACVWLDVHGCGCCSGSDPNPTHWMPLPPPPGDPS